MQKVHLINLNYLGSKPIAELLINVAIEYIAEEWKNELNAKQFTMANYVPPTLPLEHWLERSTNYPELTDYIAEEDLSDEPTEIIAWISECVDDIKAQQDYLELLPLLKSEELLELDVFVNKTYVFVVLTYADMV